MSRCGQLELRQDTAPLLRQGHQRGLVRAKKPGTKSGTGAPLRRRFSCVAGPNRLKVTAAQLVLRRLSMQKWELTYEIVGSAIAIGALLVLLWLLGLVS